MSAIGPKQTCTSALQMSAFGGKADMAIALRNVCFQRHPHITTLLQWSVVVPH
jgi:hypothetical protein